MRSATHRLFSTDPSPFARACPAKAVESVHCPSQVKSWGASALTLHGRTRQQRYSRLADWQYIQECARLAEVPLIGNGDIYSWRDFEDNVVNGSVATGM